MYCQRCGAAVPPDPEARYCRSCGALLPATAEEPVKTPGDEHPPDPTQAPIAPTTSAGAGTTTSPATAPGVPYGGFLVRLVAYLIDSTIISTVVGVVGALLAVVALLAGMSGLPDVDSAAFTALVFALIGVLLLISLTVTAAYYIVLPPLYGATPGKLILGYEIVDADLRRIGYGTATLRLLGYIVSNAVLYLGFIWIGIDDRKQGWHDKIAGTFVVKREAVRR